MSKTKIIFRFSLVLLFLFHLSFGGLPENVASGSVPDGKGTVPNQEATKLGNGSVQEKNLSPASFKLVTDVIDGFGGQKSNSACDRYIFAGGQSSAIGSGTSTNFKLYAGFVYPTVVKCGDANADGSLTVSDVVYLVNYLFKGGPVAKPYEAGEANCDGKVTVSDVVYLVNYLFKGGAVPIC